MLRRLVAACALALVAVVVLAPVTLLAADTWPQPGALIYMRVTKNASGGGDNKEPTDPRWAHLHEHETDAESVSLRVDVVTYLSSEPILNINPSYTYPATLEVRYTVHGNVVSDWIDAKPTNYGAFTLAWDDPDLDALGCSGIHDIGVEVRANADTPITYFTTPPNPQRSIDFDVDRMFLHIHRDEWPDCTEAPLIHDNSEGQTNRHGVVYANPNTGFAALASVNYNVKHDDLTTWSGFPMRSQDLYVENMQPTSDLFEEQQFIWEEPAGTVDAGLKFFRPLPPKIAEYLSLLYDGGSPIAFDAFGGNGHRTFPVIDGPRGVGWTNGYIQGGQQSFDSDGNFLFVNVSGQLRVMEPNGELHTIAGWRVDPSKSPVWVLKPLNSIRANMELRGNWPGNDSNATELARSDPGFHQPMDVVLDKDDDTIAYIAGGYDHCIYKVVFNPATWEATSITVLAGQRGTAGFANGTGASAQFWFPISLTQDQTTGDLYVADMDNDAIRKVTLAGVVTTLYGHNDLIDRLEAADGTKVHSDSAHPGSRDIALPASFVRANSVYEVDSTAASMGDRPDFHLPWTVRMRSDGWLVVMDRGMNSIRKVNLSTHVTEELFNFNDGGFSTSGTRGWIWLDVDQVGATGPTDTMYFAQATSYDIPNQECGADHFNEQAWQVSADGSQEYYILGPGCASDNAFLPDGWGKVAYSDFKHYPWLVAADPNGALLMAGIGEHGISRARVRRASDPFFTSGASYVGATTTTEEVAYREARSIWSAGCVFKFNGFWQAATEEAEFRSCPKNPKRKFGPQATNMIGFASAWQLTGDETNEELATLFDLDDAIADDEDSMALMRWFLMLHKGPELEDAEEPEPEPSVRRRLRFRVQ